MSIRPWVAAIAFGLVAILLPLSVDSQEGEAGDGRGATQADQDTSDNSPWAIPIQIIEDQAEAEAGQAREDRAEQRELDDLAAQQGMNESTQRMADYSLYQTFLVGLGTLFLGYTLYLTRQMSASAWAAVNVTREIGEAQARAYIAITEPRLIISKDKAFCIFNVHNTGQSPADSCSANAVLKMRLSDGLFEQRKAVFLGRISSGDKAQGTVSFDLPPHYVDRGEASTFVDFGVSLKDAFNVYRIEGFTFIAEDEFIHTGQGMQSDLRPCLGSPQSEKN